MDIITRNISFGEATMGNRGTFTKILAIFGTGLVWIPILVPVLFSIIFLLSEGKLMFDYLIPAELFLIVLIGGVLLVLAAFRARTRQRITGWGLGLAITMLFLGQVLAIMTGLAESVSEPAGWWWTIVVVTLVAYDLAVILLGVGSVLLLRDLFRSHRH